jgi:hypothetical protein
MPFTLEFVPVLPHMHAVPFCFTINPLPDVRFDPISATPNTVALLATIAPFPIIHFPVVPSIYTLLMRLTISILAIISVKV